MRWLVITLAALAASPAHAIPEDVSGRSGAPVPRFVSLAASEANARAGPGEQYPIRWVYRGRGLPLEVVREWGPWREVRDAQGEGGWMLKALLSGERGFLVTGAVRTLHERPDIASRPVWRAEPGVVARILTCQQAWCRVSAGGRSGWILRAHGWGVRDGETID
ncbi:MAG: SH3 domain-containing protein [Sphingomonadaceae bacterium]